MIHRSGPDVETRLRQTSLYRPDLDLLVLDSRDGVAAYGLLWFDPETVTGLVEPMRIEDDHQQRGLARHLLTVVIDLLAEAGAVRIKICFEPDNPASRGLYLNVGFEPVKQCAVYPVRPRASAIPWDARSARSVSELGPSERQEMLSGTVAG
jgi:GNAT superfamily N-acetyltransferase